MSLFKKVRDSLVEKIAPKAGEVAARHAAKQAKRKLDDMGKRLENALFGEGEGDESPPSSSGGERKTRAEERAEKEAAALETRKKLEAAQRRVDERNAREAAEKKERAAAAAKLERDVDDELAAMKKKLGK